MPRLRAFGSFTVMPVTPGPPRAAVTFATRLASLPRRFTETLARGSQPGVVSSCSNADSLPLYAVSFTLIVRSVPLAHRSCVSAQERVGAPTIELELEASHRQVRVRGERVARPEGARVDRAVEPHRHGRRRRIRRPGRVAGVLKAMYTGPCTGVAWSGESIVAVPTRELSGQLLALDASREHARWAPGRLGWTDSGRITSARLSAASSGSNLSVVLTSGNWLARHPGAPNEPSAFGVKAESCSR